MMTATTITPFLLVLAHLELRKVRFCTFVKIFIIYVMSEVKFDISTPPFGSPSRHGSLATSTAPLDFTGASNPSTPIWGMPMAASVCVLLHASGALLAPVTPPRQATNLSPLASQNLNRRLIIHTLWNGTYEAPDFDI
jgi:hypothetical protein